MDCHEADAALDCLMDGDSSLYEQRQVLAHLEVCAGAGRNMPTGSCCNAPSARMAPTSKCRNSCGTISPPASITWSDRAADVRRDGSIGAPWRVVLAPWPWSWLPSWGPGAFIPLPLHS